MTLLHDRALLYICDIDICDTYNNARSDEPEPEPMPEPSSEFARATEMAGRVDNEMAAGTQVEIWGRRGVYRHFEWKMMGANLHHIQLFDGESGTTVVKLRDETALLYVTHILYIL